MCKDTCDWFPENHYWGAEDRKMFHSYDLFIVVQYILKKFAVLQLEFLAGRKCFKGVQATGYDERYLVIFR